MAIDLSEIQLSPEQKQLVAERAAQSGQSWQTVLQEALMLKGEAASRPANGSHQSAEKQDSGELSPDFDEDTEFLALCMEDLREIEAEQATIKKPTIEDARRILAKVPGSMLEDINSDEDEADCNGDGVVNGADLVGAGCDD